MTWTVDSTSHLWACSPIDDVVVREKTVICVLLCAHPQTGGAFWNLLVSLYRSRYSVLRVSGAGRPVTVPFPVRMVVTVAAVVGLTPCTLVSRKGVFLPTLLPVNQASSPRQPSLWPEEELAFGAGTDLVRAQATLHYQRGALHPTLLFWIICQWN